MYSIQEQFKTDALAQLNSKVRDAQQIAGNLLEVSREIGVLNVRTTKASAEVLAFAVQKLMSATNPTEFFQLAASVMRPDMQAWTSYTEQLRSIAGKMTAPPAAAPAVPDTPATPDSLAAVEGYVRASEATPELAPPAPAPAPAPAPEAAASVALAAPAEEPPAAPDAVAPQPVVEKAAPVQAELLAPLSAPAPVAAASVAAPAPAPAASKPSVQKSEVVTKVADAMKGVSKAPAAVLAASAAPAKPQTVSSAPTAAKSAIKPATRTAPVKPAPQKAGPPARSNVKRGKKG